MEMSGQHHPRQRTPLPTEQETSQNTATVNCTYAYPTSVTLCCISYEPDSTVTDLRVWKQNCDPTFRKSKVLRFPTESTPALSPTRPRIDWAWRWPAASIWVRRLNNWRCTSTRTLGLGGLLRGARPILTFVRARLTVTTRSPASQHRRGHTISHAHPELASRWMASTYVEPTFVCNLYGGLSCQCQCAPLRQEMDGVRRKWSVLRYLTSEVRNSTE